MAYTHEEMTQRLKGKAAVMVEHYRGILTPINFRCVTCHHVWKCRPDNIYHGKGCPNCAKASFGAHHKRSLSEVRKLLASKQMALEGSYIGAGYKCTGLKCLVCKHSWRGRINQLRGCPSCSQQRSGYARKDVTVKGRNFRLQGYEPIALQWMVRTGKTQIERVKTGVEVSRFRYIDRGKERTYFPDFELPGKRIVEVKSDYTLLGKAAWFRTAVAKRNAVVQAGYKFNLVVFDKNEARLQLPREWWKLKASQVRQVLRPATR